MSVTDKANYAVKQLESLDSVRSTCGFKRSLFDGNDSDAISLSVLDGDADAFGAIGKDVPECRVRYCPDLYQSGGRGKRYSARLVSGRVQQLAQLKNPENPAMEHDPPASSANLRDRGRSL